MQQDNAQKHCHHNKRLHQPKLAMFPYSTGYSKKLFVTIINYFIQHVSVANWGTHSGKSYRPFDTSEEDNMCTTMCDIINIEMMTVKQNHVQQN